MMISKIVFLCFLHQFFVMMMVVVNGQQPKDSCEKDVCHPEKSSNYLFPSDIKFPTCASEVPDYCCQINEHLERMQWQRKGCPDLITEQLLQTVQDRYDKICKNMTAEEFAEKVNCFALMERNPQYANEFENFKNEVSKEWDGLKGQDVSRYCWAYLRSKQKALEVIGHQCSTTDYLDNNMLAKIDEEMAFAMAGQICKEPSDQLSEVAKMKDPLPPK